MNDIQIREIAIELAIEAIKNGSLISFEILFEAYENSYRELYAPKSKKVA